MTAAVDCPSIVDALAFWGEWHAEISPLGATGDYFLDLRLADAFRALLYLPGLNDRLTWLVREAARTRRMNLDPRYHVQIARWHNALFEAEKVPIIERRKAEREALCVSL